MRKIKIVNKKLIVFSFILGLVISGGIAYAASQILASDISYRDGTVESALNDLYSKANSNTGTVCIRQSGTSLTVSAKYLCELGDNSPRSFYVLAVNGDTVKMIMEKNLSDEIGSVRTMIHYDALTYFNEGNPGYSTKQAWLTKVQSVGLPDAQDIANAGGMNNGTTTSWNVATATTSNWSYFGVNSTSDPSRIGNYVWLYDYTKDCSQAGCSNPYGNSIGYWTNDLVTGSDPAKVWAANKNGALGVDPTSNSTYFGVRPVITLSKSKLAG